MDANTVRVIVTDGIAEYSTEMLVIVGSVLVVIVGFFVLRHGLRMMADIDIGRGSEQRYEDKINSGRNRNYDDQEMIKIR